MIASSENGLNGTVLIVDDDEMISGALRQRLEDTGLIVTVVTNPVNVPPLLGENNYGLILLDTYMTGQLHERANDLLDEVRRLRGRAHLVILTAYGVEEMTRRFRDEKDVTVARKPMPINVLAELVEALVAIEPPARSKRSLA